MSTLAERHDCLLLDLDGTVFRGHQPTPDAHQALQQVAARQLFVTNNASRSAADVAAHLRDLGFPAQPDDVVTSAQSGAHLLAGQLPAGARVLVVGTESLADEIRQVGLAPVRNFDDAPVAVVQGYSPDTGWAQLAEAALAIRAGALWVATNVDKTLPSERGLLPGNGSLVGALQIATDAQPQVAGKPAPAVFRDALTRGDFAAPLAIGDRLDTDIAAARAAALPSLMVLTGVSTAAEAVHASPEQRPDYLAATLAGLHVPADRLAIAAQPNWSVDRRGDVLTVAATGVDDGCDGLSVVRAAAHAVWSADGLGPIRIEAGDDTAAAALRRWSLLSADRLA